YLAEPLVFYRRRPGSLSSSTHKLHRATGRLYEKAEARLAGRPEARTAAAMVDRMRDMADWAEGEDLVIAGNTLAGLRVLRHSHAERRSARWRLIMLVFRVMPPL